MPIRKAEACDNYAFFSPTRRDVQQHIIKVVSEIVGKYRVDGVHLDYVRFPDSSYSYDPKSRVAYMKAAMRDHVSFAQWRREELTAFVGDLRRHVKMVRPEVQLSAAVWQVIEAGRTGYFQDGVEWVRRGCVDFVVPMVYTVAPALFADRIKAYADSVGADRVVAGIGAYLEGFDEGVLRAQVGQAQAVRARGVSIFNSDYALVYGDVLRRLVGAGASGE
jgi:uncharacterized lipoprotein YddW (UPF0748 family)